MVSLLSPVPAAWLTSHGGYLDSVIIPTNTESAQALDLIKRELPPMLPYFGLIFRSQTLKATDSAFKAEVEQALEPLRKDPHVASVSTPYNGPEENSRDISSDGRAIIAKVEIKDESANQNELTMDNYPM
jgi:hypothetical protein